MRSTTIIDVKSARKESRYFFMGGLAFQLFASNFLAFCFGGRSVVACLLYSSLNNFLTFVVHLCINIVL